MTKRDNDLIEKEIEDLRDDLDNSSAKVSCLVREKVRKAADKAKSMYSYARDNREEVVGKAKEKLSNAEKHVREHVRERPHSSVAIAAGLGFLAALLLRR